MAKLQALLGLMLVAFFTGSCLPLYIPTPPIQDGNARITEEQFKFFQVGKTQRKDVLLQFGGPAWTWQNERFYVYSWELVHGIFFMVSIIGADEEHVSKIYYLCLEFAPDGTLKRFTHIEGLSRDKAQEKIAKWMKEQ